MVIAGEYGSISVSFTFSRQFYTYLVEYYLPAVFVVLISWLPFWLGRVLILRIYIAFGTTVFLCWHTTVVKATEVTVAYATLLDFWRGMNLIFVFTAAFESIFIAYMIKSNKNFIKRTCKEDNEKFQMLTRGNNCPLKVSTPLSRFPIAVTSTHSSFCFRKNTWKWSTKRRISIWKR